MFSQKSKTRRFQFESLEARKLMAADLYLQFEITSVPDPDEVAQIQASEMDAPLFAWAILDETDLRGDKEGNDATRSLTEQQSASIDSAIATYDFAANDEAQVAKIVIPTNFGVGADAEVREF